MLGKGKEWRGFPVALLWILILLGLLGGCSRRDDTAFSTAESASMEASDSAGTETGTGEESIFPAGSGEVSDYGPVKRPSGTEGASGGEGISDEEGASAENSARRQLKYQKIAVLLKGDGQEETEGEILQELLMEAGCEVRLSYAAGDIGRQREALEAAEAWGAALYLVEPVDPHDKALSDQVSRLSEEGHLVLSYGTMLYEGAPLAYHVGYDPYATGKREAACLLESLGIGPGKSANIEIFTGDMTEDDLYYIYPGLMEGLYPSMQDGRIRILSGETEIEQTCTFDGSPENAAERMRRLFSYYDGTGRTLDAVVCTDARQAAGVRQAFLETGHELEKTLMVTASQESPAANARLSKESRVLFWDGERLSRAAAELLTTLAYGESVPVNNKTDYDNGSGRIPCYLLVPEES